MAYPTGDYILNNILLCGREFQKAVRDALERYRTERDQARKDSEQYIASQERFAAKKAQLIEIARAAIAKAERVFTAKVEEQALELEGQMRRIVFKPVNPEFMAKLSLIREFEIQPERIEIEELLQLNGGSEIGLRALSSVLKKLNSPFILKYHSTRDYLADIEKVRALTRNLKYTPISFLSEGTEIYDGVLADYVLPDGRTIGNRVSYDAVTLTQYATAFESDLEAIEAMKQAWSADGMGGATIEDTTTEAAAIEAAKEQGAQTAKAAALLAELTEAGRRLS